MSIVFIITIIILIFAFIIYRLASSANDFNKIFKTAVQKTKIRELDSFVYTNIEPLIDDEKYTEALNLIENKLEQYPNEPILYLYRGKINDLQRLEFDRDFNHAIDLSDDLDQLIDLGEEFFFEGFFTFAEKAFKKALTFGENVEIFKYLGDIYYQLDDTEKAEKNYLKALDIDPSDDEVYHSLAIIYVELSRYEEALVQINKAIDIEADDVEFLNERAGIYIELGETDKAIEDMNHIVDVNKSYTIRAVRFFELKMYDKAIEDYNRAISSDKKNYILYFNRSRAYKAIGDLDSAIKDINSSVELNPCAFTYYYRAELLLEAKKFNDALLDVNRALSEEKDSQKYMLRSKIYYAIGELDKAKADIIAAEKIEQEI